MIVGPAVPTTVVRLSCYLLAIVTTAAYLWLFARNNSELWDVAAGYGWAAGTVVLLVGQFERALQIPTGTAALSAGMDIVLLLLLCVLTVWALEDTVIERPESIDSIEQRYPDWLIRGL